MRNKVKEVIEADIKSTKKKSKQKDIGKRKLVNRTVGTEKKKRSLRRRKKQRKTCSTGIFIAKLILFTAFILRH